MTTRYRVQFKRRITDDWQTTPAMSAHEAQTIQRGYRRRLWIAVVQFWNEMEGRWI